LKRISRRDFKRISRRDFKKRIEEEDLRKTKVLKHFWWRKFKKGKFDLMHRMDLMNRMDLKERRRRKREWRRR